jgi:cytochrome d ubiquinol oxidase subunit I
VFGVYNDGHPRFGLKIPSLDSILVGFSPATKVIGLDSVPASERPPAPTLLHWAFDMMVGIGTALLLLATWFAFSMWRRRAPPESRWFLRGAAIAGLAAIVALECGWIVTEVGRQPWIVYRVLRTSDAVTHRDGVVVTLVAVIVLYTLLGVATVAVLRRMSRRWREEQDVGVPYGPRAPAPTEAGSA